MLADDLGVVVWLYSEGAIWASAFELWKSLDRGVV